MLLAVSLEPAGRGLTLLGVSCFCSKVFGALGWEGSTKRIQRAIKLPVRILEINVNVGADACCSIPPLVPGES